jgi:putative effector of murein hydrolase LrgA (UPF0299 family)
MILKKSWFYIMIFTVILIVFMYLDTSIVNQPEQSWYLFLTSMILMIITSVVAIILSFRETKTSEETLNVFSLARFIFSICLTIFASGWLVLILLIQYQY